tara:strand:+ start:339 stop:695 length:357 start_codon:yes stop_codon:yes gene_type:complete
MKYIRKKDLKAKIERQLELIRNLRRDRTRDQEAMRMLGCDIKQLSNRIMELEHPEEFNRGDKVKLLSASDSGIIKVCYIGVVTGSIIIKGCITWRNYEIITPDGRTVYSKGSDLKKTK